MVAEIDERYRKYCLWLEIYIALLRQPVTEPIADGYVRKLALEKFHQAHNEFLNEDDNED